MRILAFVLPTVIALAISGASYAQTSTATLQGQVTDPSGALIPETRVFVENVRTGVRLDTTTNEQGRYLVPFLQPGDYQLMIEKAGFQRFLRSGIKLDVQQNLVIDVRLALGDVASAVEVTGAAPPLATANATIATTIDNRRVVDLPLNSRNVLALALTTATASMPNSQSGAQQDQWTGALGGGRTASSAVLVDGASINVSNPGAGMSPFGMQPPSVDAVEEFTVQVNALAAEYGRTGGGVIQVATKQGTNQFHGTLREFLRNSAMDANNFFSNRAGVPLGSLKRHQFGFSLGGPILIPKVYNGRNRTFFFADYEVSRLRTLSPFTGTMPLEKWKTGDFSALRFSSGAAITIYDPLTTRPDAGGYTRDAFAGNLIPASRIDPVARNVVRFYSLPNTRSTNAFAEVNNFFVAGTGADDNENITIRLDHNPAAAWRTYLRLNWADRYQNQPDYLGNKVTNGSDFNTPRYGAVWDNVFTLSPSAILGARYSLSRFHRTRNPLHTGFDPSSLGFPAYVGQFAAAELSAFPQFAVSGLSTIGGGTANLFVPTTHSFVTTLTKVMGKHTFKMGLEYRKNLLNFWQNGQSSGSFSYGAVWTQRDPARSSTTEGFGFASLLLGLGSGQQARTTAIATASNYYGLYFQDDYRLTTRLTLNLGLRYDLDTTRTERYNRFSWFDLSAPSPIAGQVPGFADLKGVMRFADDNHRQQTPTDFNNFSPRFGFAYQVDARTVVRGGYALMYDNSVMGAGNGGLNGFAATTTMITSLDGRTPLNYLRNPFPNGYLEPGGSTPGPTSGPNTLLGQSISDGWFIDYVNPVIQQWNFNLQRELPGGLVIEAGYLANKGNHLIDGESNQHNQLTANYLSLGNSLNDLVSNPFYRVIQDSTSPLSQPTVQRRQLLRPLPQYTGLSPNLMAIANSVYHAFTLRVEKRISSGFGFLLAYTAGKAISDAEGSNFFNEGGASTRQDMYNRRADRSVSSQDVASRLALSASFELPFGRGRRFLPNIHPVVDGVVGGWQVNGLMTLQSGLPVIMYQSFNNTGLGNSAQRPNSNGKSAALSGGSADGRLQKWFDISAFSLAPAFTFGNAPRVLPDVHILACETSIYPCLRRSNWSARGCEPNSGSKPSMPSTRPNSGAPAPPSARPRPAPSVRLRSIRAKSSSR